MVCSHVLKSVMYYKSVVYSVQAGGTAMFCICSSALSHTQQRENVLLAAPHNVHSLDCQIIGNCHRTLALNLPHVKVPRPWNNPLSHPPSYRVPSSKFRCFFRTSLPDIGTRARSYSSFSRGFNARGAQEIHSGLCTAVRSVVKASRGNPKKIALAHKSQTGDPRTTTPPPRRETPRAFPLASPPFAAERLEQATHLLRLSR